MILLRFYGTRIADNFDYESGYINVSNTNFWNLCFLKKIKAHPHQNEWDMFIFDFGIYHDHRWVLNGILYFRCHIAVQCT